MRVSFPYMAVIFISIPDQGQAHKLFTMCFLSAVTFIDTSSHHESASQPGLVKLTKCVTIRNFEHEDQSERQPLLPQNWLNCFNVTSQTRQALKKSSDWESADTSHLLLDIDLPNQQLHHLPLLITPVHCSYLITFDLRNHQESLDKIHNAMKNVFAHTQYKMKAGASKEPPPKVHLVGMHADDEQANEKSFAHKLGQMLQRKPYDWLVHKPSKPGCDEPFWAVNGGNLSLSGTDPLSCAIQSSCSWHNSEVRQWIKCHKELRERLKDVPCIPYSNLREHVAGTESGVETSRFDDFLHFLHGYGFIFYHSIEEGQDTDKVVLLQPEYLCKLLAEVLKLKESRKRPTFADLTSSTAACMEATAKHSQWLQRICIDMGLVFEVVNAVNSISDYVFLMGLEPGPSCPSQEFYSVAPLLVTFKALGPDKQKEERLLPSYFFAAFVTEFVRSLMEHNSDQNESKDQANLLEVVSMEQHYLQVCISNTYIHVVEREFCIEVGLQQVELPARKMSDKKMREMIVKKMRKMHSMCKDVRGVVVKSVEQLQKRLKLAPAILYGFYHTRSARDCGDGFAQYNPSRSDEVPYLRCRCCETPDHPTTPEQEIWFEEEEDFNNFEEVRTYVYIRMSGIISTLLLKFNYYVGGKYIHLSHKWRPIACSYNYVHCTTSNNVILI